MSSLRARTADALQISKTTVTKYVTIGESGAEFSTPGKDRSRESPIRNVSDAVKDQIAEIIYEFAERRKP